MTPVLQAVSASAPGKLVSQADALLASAEAVLDDVLLRYWNAPSDDQFFAKAFLKVASGCGTSRIT